MFAQFKRLAGQSSLYTVGEVLRGSLAFLLLPVYTRLLSPADYGVLGVMSPVFSLLSILMALGIPAALLRFYFDYRDDSALLRRYIGTLTWFGVACGLVGSLALTLIGPWLFGRLLPNTPFNPYVLITVWNAGFSIVSVLALQLWRAREQAQRFIAFSLADFLLTTALIVLFVVVWRQGALGSLLGQWLAAVVMAVPALWVLWRAGAPTFSWRLLRPSLRFGLPALPFLLGTWALNVSDRIVLDALTPGAAVGLYTLGYQFGTLLNMIAMALNNAWAPFYYQRAGQRQNDPMIGAFITYQVALMVLLALSVALLAPEAIQIIAAPAYRSASRVVPWIAAGYVARFLFFFPANALLFCKRPRWVAAATVGAAALNIGANWLLVPRFGIGAAALNTLVAFVVLFAVTQAAARRTQPVPFETRRLFILLLIALGLFALGWWFGPPALLPSMAYKLLLIAALPPLLWLSGFFTPSERTRMLQLARQAGRLVQR